MPLEAGESKRSFSHNVATEMKAGKPQAQALAIAYREAKTDAVDFGELKKQLSEFLTEEAREPEHKNDKLDAIAERVDSLQPNPWANKLAALNGGIDSLTARLARRSDAINRPQERPAGWSEKTTMGTKAEIVKYNAEAVQKEINKDKRIGSKEAKLIHSLLKGRS